MKSAFGLAGWLAASLAAGFIGSRYMPGAWYEALVKPAWTPPGWVFAPVWTVLYVLMGVAAWLVWSRVRFKGARVALSLFIVQLALNALWSYVFFGAHRIDLAFFEILVLWGVILIVTGLFRREVSAAGLLMLPYVFWVGFAAYLNFALCKGCSHMMSSMLPKRPMAWHERYPASYLVANPPPVVVCLSLTRYCL